MPLLVSHCLTGLLSHRDPILIRPEVGEFGGHCWSQTCYKKGVCVTQHNLKLVSRASNLKKFQQWLGSKFSLLYLFSLCWMRSPIRGVEHWSYMWFFHLLMLGDLRPAIGEYGWHKNLLFLSAVVKKTWLMLSTEAQVFWGLDWLIIQILGG